MDRTAGGTCTLIHKSEKNDVFKRASLSILSRTAHPQPTTMNAFTDSPDLQQIIESLEQAVLQHRQWSAQLHRTLVCHLPIDTYDLQPDTHHHCGFGTWYDSLRDTAVSAYLSFKQLETAHTDMHETARVLLRHRQNDEPIGCDEYDRFLKAQENLTGLTWKLQSELMVQLHGQDPLTGLPTRRDMSQRIEREVLNINKGQNSCCIGIMDVDHFKRINDNYGHHAGDEVLREVARRAVNLLRRTDQVFRYGGEEFVFFLPGIPLNGAHSVLDRLRAGIAEQSVHLHDGRELEVTASFGITEIVPGETTQNALTRADEALYAAKAAGRNRVMLRTA